MQLCITPEAFYVNANKRRRICHLICSKVRRVYFVLKWAKVVHNIKFKGKIAISESVVTEKFKLTVKTKGILTLNCLRVFVSQRCVVEKQQSYWRFELRRKLG